ncbi:purine-nucleoside phosphorylase [Paenibacillus arenosi]|uniref:Purine nucleoside phosphorylase DeoD-type n=1 Tax=Paenibacillus arenosi TaxID=2774142 RepID=A0ABR9AXA5_9BACL|nr:purine-nucleoside phosphorylase [Paenibacillus arenosi]MBD8497842.1 purine-nucleoside phosphorylase [Paenibacillus arenosi]
MSIHLEAPQGAIAEKVLLPGDPLRAKHIAETFLEDVQCYNQVRNMLGFTGTYKGERISVQGTGMGIPSFSIYATELIKDYGVKTLVRVGTCGAIQHEVQLREVLMAQGVTTDSSIISHYFPGLSFSPIADFDLLHRAYMISQERQMQVRVGNVHTSDYFYSENPEAVNRLGNFGVMAVEMETAALYTLAAKHGVKALSLLTVSDHILTGEQTSSQERQTTFNQMIELALDAIVEGK